MPADGRWFLTWHLRCYDLNLHVKTKFGKHEKFEKQGLTDLQYNKQK